MFDRVSRVMGFVKDLLEIVLKLSPLALVPPALTVWVYLRKLGWSELFGESVGSVPGLLALISGSALILLSFALQVIAPSLFFGAAGEVLEGERQHPELAASKAYWLHFVPVIVWQLCFSISIGYFSAEITSPILLASALSWAISALMAVKYRKQLITRRLEKSINDKKRDSVVWGYARYIIFMMAVSICPLIISISSAVAILGMWWVAEGFGIANPLIFVILCCVTAFVSIIPGLAYLSARIEGHPPRKLWFLTAVAVGGVLYVAMTVALFMAPISKQSLELAGVNDKRPHVYQLLNESLLPSVYAAGIPAYSTRLFTAAGKEGIFLGAYLQFNFGGIKLLCVKHYDAYEESGRKAAAREAEEPSNDRRGKGCVPFKNEDVRALRAAN